MTVSTQPGKRAPHVSTASSDSAPLGDRHGAAYGSAELIVGAIARNAAGACGAASHWLKPMYEPPHMPTEPSHHGCAVSQASVSSVSAASWTCGSNKPGDREVPRTSCATTTYPAATSANTSGSFGFPYRPASSFP